MKAQIQDADILRLLRPLNVTSYLRTNGWTLAEFQEDRYSVWTREDDLEVLLPLRSDFRDFARRMAELLQTLALVEDRSQLDILSDLLLTGTDMIRLRLHDEDLSDGSMAIEDFARTVQKTRDLMMAAALAAIDSRPVWHKRKPDQAVNYLRSVRIGQSERGSYVFTILSRVAPMLRTGEQMPFEEMDEPFERRVTAGLARALRATEQAADFSAASQSMDRFEAAVPVGVSANLCEALAGISTENDRDRTLEFRFSWSPNRPPAQGQISQIRIAGDRIPFVREAARVFRSRVPVEDFDLEGPVIRLDRLDGAPTGTVTVYAPVETEHRKIQLELAEPEYGQAVAAHRDGHAVRCSGRLTREGRGYRLRNPVDFSVRRDEG